MICTIVMGKVAKSMSTDTRVPGNLHSLIGALVQQRSKLSGRVRCYHKHIGGVAHSARDAWRIMEKVSESNSEGCECAADDVDSWIVSIRQARLEGNQLEILEALGDLCCEPSSREKLVALGQWLTVAEEGGNCVNAELRGCGLNVRCELTEAAAKVIKQADFHQAAMDKNLTVESQTQDAMIDDGTSATDVAATDAKAEDQTKSAEADIVKTSSSSRTLTICLMLLPWYALLM